MTQIVIHAKLQAKSDAVETLMKELEKVVGPSRNESGNLVYKVHQDLEHPQTFLFYEVWEDEDAFQQHVESEHYQQYRKQIESLVETREVTKSKELFGES